MAVLAEVVLSENEIGQAAGEAVVVAGVPAEVVVAWGSTWVSASA